MKETIKNLVISAGNCDILKPCGFIGKSQGTEETLSALQQDKYQIAKEKKDYEKQKYPADLVSKKQKQYVTED